MSPCCCCWCCCCSGAERHYTHSYSTFLAKLKAEPDFACWLQAIETDLASLLTGPSWMGEPTTTPHRYMEGTHTHTGGPRGWWHHRPCGQALELVHGGFRHADAAALDPNIVRDRLQHTQILSWCFVVFQGAAPASSMSAVIGCRNRPEWSCSCTSTWQLTWQLAGP